MRGRLGSFPPPGGQWGCVEFKFPDVLLSRLTLCTAHCSAVCLTQLSLAWLCWGWRWPSLVQARAESPQSPGGPGPHNSHCAAFSACDHGGDAAPGPLPAHHRRITQHSTLTGTRDRGPWQTVSVFFSQYFCDFLTTLFSHMVLRSN